MGDWYPTVYKACICAGAIAFIIGSFTESKTSLGAYISGYSVFIIGVMLILTILFANILKTTNNKHWTEILYALIMSSGPFILILGIISFILYLLITYKNNIIDGKVAPGYNSFSNIIVMLLLIQFYLVYTNMNDDRFRTTGKLSKVTSSIIYLLGVLTSISSVILYTILKYFSTDGFQIMG